MGENIEAIYGPLAKNWRMVRLKDLVENGTAELQTGPFGTMLHASAYQPKGTPVIAVQHIGENSLRQGEYPLVDDDDTARLSRYKVRENDILFGRKGAVDRRALIRSHESGWLQGSDCIRLRFNETIDARYISYVLGTSAYKQWIVRHAHGATMPSLNQEILGLIPLPLPPLPEQKRIAHILGTLDDKIELNQRMNATLEAMARALFKSWFVDFDPVRAKIDGRKPEGMDAETAALFPSEFSHSEHGVCPIGWKYVTIAELCDINAWNLDKKDDLATLEYIEISEVNRGDIANIATYQRGEEPSRARRRLCHGDTVLSTVRPDRGAYFLVLNPPDNRIASTGFAVLTPTKAPWSFIHAALTQPEVFYHLGQMADGGAYPAVRPEIIGAMRTVMPNAPKILETFHRICAPLFEQAEANRLQSRTLATLRDTLLPKLLRGESCMATVNA